MRRLQETIGSESRDRFDALANQWRSIARILFFIVIFCASSSLAKLCYGDSLLISTTELYRRHAFGNEDGRFRKFQKQTGLTIQTTCMSHPKRACTEHSFGSLIHEAFPRDQRFGFVPVKNNPDIKLVFADAGGMLYYEKMLRNTFKAGYRDNRDLDCQLYYDVKGDIISKAVILVSLDASQQKQQVCLIFQVPHALGLSLPNGKGFFENWPISADLNLSKADNKYLTRMRKNFEVLIYIHLCPDLRPGMNLEDINHRLAKSSGCLKGLKPNAGIDL